MSAIEPIQPVLIAGQWRPSQCQDSITPGVDQTFHAENPAAQARLPDRYPISNWNDCEAVLDAAAGAAAALRTLPPEAIAAFLDEYANRIEARRDELVEMAHLETALPRKPRLADVELPRTTGQLRLAAAAAREGSWALPTIDTKNQIRSCLMPIGPVAVFGPNNFPFAFNSVAGGDFAAAIAAGNPVIAKANSGHPGTSRLLAEEAHVAATSTGLPPGTVQLLYRMSHNDGERLVTDRRLGATAYTGGRSAGLALKTVADIAGKPIYLELSSINPIVVLPGAIRTRGQAIADEFTTSCLMGTGQFCTNPGLVLMLAGPETEEFIGRLVEKFRGAAVGTLLSRGVAKNLGDGIGAWKKAGAEILAGGSSGGGAGYSHANTLARASGQKFLAAAEALQTEAFGNASLLVVAHSPEELAAVIDHLEGNLTGCLYTDTAGSDDALYAQLEPHLRPKVGRLLNDKMPTGVAVSPAMNHGGPFPATGHPGFTAVGIPASLRRFGMLACYDGVRADRLPPILQNTNPGGRVWRSIDGVWTQGNVT